MESVLQTKFLNTRTYFKKSDEIIKKALKSAKT